MTNDGTNRMCASPFLRLSGLRRSFECRWEAHAFRAGVVQDFNGIAVEDGDDRGGKVQREYG